MTLKKFPENFCVKGHPLCGVAYGGVCKGGNGGRGYGGRGTPYIWGRGTYIKKPPFDFKGVFRRFKDTLFSYKVFSPAELN